MRDKARVMAEANQEPSMEEILASIKRVIADDTREQPTRGPRNRRSEPELVPEPEPDTEDEEDVLELDMPMKDAEALLSPDKAAASRQSLAALAALRHQDDDYMDPVDQAPLEAVVRDMLRPLLKQWLEQRLPDMVEEMVAREIARITGKRL
jgi:cell pole-organizing protein PopZ